MTFRSHVLFCALLLTVNGCTKPALQFTPEIRQRYNLSADDLTRVQFFVGVLEGPYRNYRREVVFLHRTSETERQTQNASLSTKTVLMQKDFFITDALPGVFVHDSIVNDGANLDIDVGKGAILTFRHDNSNLPGYRLVAVNGVPYKEKGSVDIEGTSYTIQVPQRVVLMFNENNAFKIFTQRVAAQDVECGSE